MTEDLIRLKKQNAPDGFSVWIRKYGTAQSGGNADTIASELARSTHTHGTGAERLYGKGLSDSGYASYLAQQEKRSLEAQKKALASESAATREKNLSGYAKYLTSHEESQKSLTRRVTESISRGDSLDLENAFRVALAAGLTEENARSAAEIGIGAAKKQATAELLEMILDKRLQSHRVKQYALKMGFSEEEAETFSAYAKDINTVKVPNEIPDNLFE